MKSNTILFAVQACAAAFAKYYRDMWDLPSIISFGSLLAFSGYLIVYLVKFIK